VNWGRDWVKTFVVPVMVLAVIVVIMSALVVAGVVQGEVVRPAPAITSTTHITVLIEP